MTVTKDYGVRKFRCYRSFLAARVTLIQLIIAEIRRINDLEDIGLTVDVYIGFKQIE